MGQIGSDGVHRANRARYAHGSATLQSVSGKLPAVPTSTAKRARRTIIVILSGNVLYTGGNMKEAAEQYYEAALGHLKDPQRPFAYGLDDDMRAAALS